jgi:hypothetical protein
MFVYRDFHGNAMVQEVGAVVNDSRPDGSGRGDRRPGSTALFEQRDFWFQKSGSWRANGPCSMRVRTLQVKQQKCVATDKAII